MSDPPSVPALFESKNSSRASRRRFGRESLLAVFTNGTSRSVDRIFADGKAQESSLSRRPHRNGVHGTGRMGCDMECSRYGPVCVWPDGSAVQCHGIGRRADHCQHAGPVPEETSRRFPQFLPDGVHYVYLVRSNRADQRGIYLGAIGSPERTRLINADSNLAFVEPGYLFFVLDGALMVQSFDVDRLVVTGEAIAVAEGVLPGPTVRRAPFSVAADVLTYRAGGMQKTQLAWIDRYGRSVGTIGAPAPYLTPALSPDGRRLAIDVLDLSGGSVDTWVFDLARDVPSRFTFGPSPNGYPVWPHDGARIVFASNRGGAWNLYEKSTEEQAPQHATADRALLESPTDKYPQDWSSEGIVYADRVGARMGRSCSISTPSV